MCLALSATEVNTKQESRIEAETDDDKYFIREEEEEEEETEYFLFNQVPLHSPLHVSNASSFSAGVDLIFESGFCVYSISVLFFSISFSFLRLNECSTHTNTFRVCAGLNGAAARHFVCPPYCPAPNNQNSVVVTGSSSSTRRFNRRIVRSIGIDTQNKRAAMQMSVCVVWTCIVRITNHSIDRSDQSDQFYFYSTDLSIFRCLQLEAQKMLGIRRGKRMKINPQRCVNEASCEQRDWIDKR